MFLDGLGHAESESRMARSIPFQQTLDYTTGEDNDDDDELYVPAIAMPPAAAADSNNRQSEPPENWPDEIFVFKIREVAGHLATNCTRDSCSCNRETVANLIQSFCEGLHKIVQSRREMCIHTVAHELMGEENKVFFTMLEYGSEGNLIDYQTQTERSNSNSTQGNDTITQPNNNPSHDESLSNPTPTPRSSSDGSASTLACSGLGEEQDPRMQIELWLNPNIYEDLETPNPNADVCNEENGREPEPDPPKGNEIATEAGESTSRKLIDYDSDSESDGSDSRLVIDSSLELDDNPASDTTSNASPERPRLVIAEKEVPELEGDAGMLFLGNEKNGGQSSSKVNENASNLREPTIRFDQRLCNIPRISMENNQNHVGRKSTETIEPNEDESMLDNPNSNTTPNANPERQSPLITEKEVPEEENAGISFLESYGKDKQTQSSSKVNEDASLPKPAMRLDSRLRNNPKNSMENLQNRDGRRSSKSNEDESKLDNPNSNTTPNDNPERQSPSITQKEVPELGEEDAGILYLGSYEKDGGQRSSTLNDNTSKPRRFDSRPRLRNIPKNSMENDQNRDGRRSPNNNESLLDNPTPKNTTLNANPEIRRPSIADEEVTREVEAAILRLANYGIDGGQSSSNLNDSLLGRRSPKSNGNKSFLVSPTSTNTTPTANANPKRPSPSIPEKEVSELLEKDVGISVLASYEKDGRTGTQNSSKLNENASNLPKPTTTTSSAPSPPKIPRISMESYQNRTGRRSPKSNKNESLHPHSRSNPSSRSPSSSRENPENMDIDGRSHTSNESEPRDPRPQNGPRSSSEENRGMSDGRPPRPNEPRDPRLRNKKAPPPPIISKSSTSGNSGHGWWMRADGHGRSVSPRPQASNYMMPSQDQGPRYPQFNNDFTGDVNFGSGHERDRDNSFERRPNRYDRSGNRDADRYEERPIPTQYEGRDNRERGNHRSRGGKRGRSRGGYRGGDLNYRKQGGGDPNYQQDFRHPPHDPNYQGRGDRGRGRPFYKQRGGRNSFKGGGGYRKNYDDANRFNE